MLQRPTESAADTTDFDPFAGPAIEMSVPSTEAQREIWTAAQQGVEASLAYNESVSVHLRGALDVDALRTAVRSLVARHESLRMTVSADGLTLFVGEAPADVELPVHEWDGLAPEGDDRLDALRRRLVEEPFDLARGPLVRFELVRGAPDWHILMITAHHIVCDGWSTSVLLHDLAELYTAQKRGTAASLEPADRFSAYAAQLSDVSREEIAADEQYWLKQFEGEIPVLDLPTARPRPSVKTYNADRVDRFIPAELITRVRSASSRKGASLFATMLSVFAVLMHRLSGDEDVVIGVPVAGQLAGHQALVGHCVQMLPLRMQLASTTRFEDLLRRARSTLLDAHEHQQLTFGSLLTLLPIARDPSRIPLISVMFNLDRALAADAMPFEGLEAHMEANARRYETFELFVNALERDGGVALECQYNTDLFDRAMVERWLASYEDLLSAVASDIGCEVGAASLVTEAERAALAAWHGPERALPVDGLVHRRIEEQAARTPTAVAVTSDGGTLTYAELNARANRLAHRLRQHGVQRGVLVGLCVERAPEMLIAQLGILKAGGGYVPLDPDYPRERLEFMVEDSGLEVLVTQARVRAELPLAVPNVIVLDDASAAEEMADADLPAEDEAGAEPESPAYVIYTSGSTGKPKGVVVPHRAVVNLLAAAAETWELSSADVVLAVTTLSFDIAVAELVLPLTVGARVVLATREVASDGARLLALVERERVTLVHATPATYRLLLSAGWTGGPTVRAVCGGEALPADLADALITRAGAVWNAYGPTETTVWSTCWRVRAPIERVLIGCPLANTRVYVLDERRQPVPIGVKGELYIGGTGVTTGYLHRPELTAERFVADPFAPEPGARMYRTGDVVRFLPSGELECLGRNDNQVKLRGYRIELGEIEDALARHPAVREAAARVREDRPGDKRLVGYVVCPADQGMPAPTDAELREHLRQRLPDYMIPQAFVRLPVMPLTPSGKIDRRALPAPTMDDVVGGDEFVEPRTESEQMVAALWAEALGVRQLGATDNFFTLGGHSLLASQVLARLRRDHGIDLSFRKIFEAPTVEQFASVIDASLASGAPSEGGALSPIAHREDDGPAPLSWLQERFWMLEQLDAEHQLVHRSPASWRLLGRLDADLLEESVRELIRRHAALRTSIQVTDGVPSQVVAADVPFSLERLDLSHLPEDRRRAELLERCNERTLTPFDLASAPLFRAMLVRFSDDEHVLYTLQHTIVWDGWSFDRFITELCEIYAARSDGRVPELPDLPRTYADFAAWQRQWTQGEEAAPHIAWWRERLADAPPPLELPGDWPRPVQPTFRGGAESLALSRAEVDALTELARANDATLAMLLLAAYNVLLFRYTDCTDLIVGSPVRARSHTEIEHVLGPFVNTIALRTVVEPERSFSELLRRVRDDSLDAFSHQELPLERLDDAAPVLRASFSMQDARTRPTRMGALTVQQYHLPQISAGSDLMLWTMLTEDGLLAVANYSSDLFEAPTARRLLQHFRTLLTSVLQDVHQPVARIALMPEEERAAIVAAASAPERTWRPVSDLFEEQATRSPGTPAVVSGDSAVSYTALRDQAAALAASLEAGGATAGTRVPILVRDGALRAASLLGVMQSGATAILVDPDDPPAYLLSVLRAAGARLAVADDDLAQDVAAALPHLSVVRVPEATEAAGATDVPADRSQRVSAVDIHWASGDAGATTAPVSDGALATLLEDLRTQVGVGSEDVVASVLPPSHDAAALEILLPLVAGATLVVLPRESVGDGEALSDALRDCGATVVVAPTEVCVSLDEAGWRGGASFRAIVPGGAVAARAIRPLAGRVGRLFVAHGHPRSGGWFSLNEVSAEVEATVIGTPAGMSRLLVLDRAMQPAPTGVWGELYVAGPAVDARAAELNGAADDTFVRNPFGGAYEWLFRTGDRARRRADGRFEYGGGTDDAGWLFGARVELAAIDRALQADPAVESAAAVLDGVRDGVPRVVAHVVSASGEPVPERQLRAAVRQVLPARMAPRLIVEVEVLPTDGAGHVDRAQLLQALSGAAAALEFVPPRTESETLLAQLWLDVLSVDRVGVHDNFFNLGGNSLSCFQVVGRLASTTGVRLSPRVLLLNTLGQAAVEIERALPAASASTPPADAPASNGALFGRLKRFVTRST